MSFLFTMGKDIEDVVEVLPAEVVEVSIDRIDLRPVMSPPLFVPSEGHRGSIDYEVFREPAVPALGAHLFEDIPGEGQKVPGGISELYNIRDFASSRLRVSQNLGGAREDAIFRVMGNFMLEL